MGLTYRFPRTGPSEPTDRTSQFLSYGAGCGE
jgi:hypothetical protein